MAKKKAKNPEGLQNLPIQRAEDVRQDGDPQEWTALLGRIFRSPQFSGRLQLIDLVEAVFKAGCDLSNAEIARQVLGIPQTHVGTAKAEARQRLREYAASPEGLLEDLVCDWPVGLLGLSFKLRTTATRTFWRDYLRSPRLILIGVGDIKVFQETRRGDGPPVVFGVKAAFHPSQGSEFELAHQVANRVRDALATEDADFTMGESYMAVSDFIAARELAEWFEADPRSTHRHKVVAVNHLAIQKVLETAPILIGDPLTNWAMRVFFDPVGPYRFILPTAKLEIKGVHETEILRLAERSFTSEYTSDTSIQVDTTSVNGHALGTLSRYQSRHGMITILASQSPTATISIASCVVDDQQLENLFQSVAWNVGQSLPAAFEILLSVLPTPGHTDSVEVIGGRRL